MVKLFRPLQIAEEVSCFYVTRSFVTEIILLSRRYKVENPKCSQYFQTEEPYLVETLSEEMFSVHLATDKYKTAEGASRL